MPNETKSELRKKLRARRCRLSPARRAEETRVIARKFLRSRAYQNASVIGFYASTSEEVATDDLIERALKAGKQVVLPRVEMRDEGRGTRDEKKNMEYRIMEYSLPKSAIIPSCHIPYSFILNTKYQILRWYEIKNLADLELGAFGLREPKKSCRKIDLKSLDLLVVPGVAFDASGHRLGYGKGFYDRVLAEFRDTSLGLAFACQLVKKIPVDEWDWKVKRVISGGNKKE